MSVRKLREQVKVIKDQVAPAAGQIQILLVMVRPGETDDQALARQGIARNERELQFVHGITEDDERL